jgi:hypothetical protein
MALIWRTAEDFEALIRQYPDQADAARQLAQADIVAGDLRFIFNDAVHYDPVDWFPDYHRLLKERLGVNGWAWQMIDAPNFDAARVFEAVHYRCMVAEIEARFGAGILNDLAAQAQEACRLRKAKRRS